MNSCQIINPKSSVPPSGVWEFGIGSDHFESPLYELVLRKTGDMLKKYGVHEDPVQALANYMCPRLPKWMCSGDGPSLAAILPRQAKEGAFKYFSRNVETVDVIQRRMERCMACPRHRRDFCLHCGGYDTWIYNGFGGRRPKLPADDASGCCDVTKTFEAVIASVCYEEGEPAWPDVPDTCWRKSK